MSWIKLSSHVDLTALHCSVPAELMVWHRRTLISSFTRPPLVLTLDEFPCSAQHKISYFNKKNVGNQIVDGIHALTFTYYGSQWLPSTICTHHSTKYLLLCSPAETHRFVITWGWVNDDRIFIFEWTISLKFLCTWNDGSNMMYISLLYLLCFGFCKTL